MKSERIPVKSFSADNGFIGKMQKLVREEVLPYQYNILNDAIPGIEKSHAIENIRLAAEKLRGKDVKPDEFYGMVFQDSDVAKWIEAQPMRLQRAKDPELEKAVDETNSALRRFPARRWLCRFLFHREVSRQNVDEHLRCT